MIIPLLCLLILFNAGGYYLVYFQVQNYFKNIAFGRINEYIPVENLTLIRINVKNLSSETQKEYKRINDHEISYDGNMYDIYKEEISGDTLVLFCLNDENEDKLDQAFSEYINKSGIDYFNVSIKSLLRSIIKIALTPIVFSYNDFSLFNLIAFKSQNELLNVIIDVPVPPPRIV
jgi:hypothetical protein